MSEPILERLNRFTPDAGGLDRDALLFAAGRESAAARPVRWFVEPEVDGLDAETAVAALERLVPEQREVIVAHHWGGLSFEQVATVVGCSASTAFRRYTAGVEVLRKRLGVTCPNRSSND